MFHRYCAVEESVRSVRSVLSGADCESVLVSAVSRSAVRGRIGVSAVSLAIGSAVGAVVGVAVLSVRRLVCEVVRCCESVC